MFLRYALKKIFLKKIQNFIFPTFVTKCPALYLRHIPLL